MALNFADIKLEIIDARSTSTPDIFVNKAFITFSQGVLDTLQYPPYVQFCMDPAQRIFAVRPCNSEDIQATQFSKPHGEQKHSVNIKSRTLLDAARMLIQDNDATHRYKVTGQYDKENNVMYFEMASAKIAIYRRVGE